MNAPIIPPLDDPDYEPIHRPVNGRPPAVVAKWGAASQVRWFRRFWDSGELDLIPAPDLADFYCHSVEHKGSVLHLMRVRRVRGPTVAATGAAVGQAGSRTTNGRPEGRPNSDTENDTRARV